jgi:transcription initiation factor IIE alpha subunit
VWDSWKGKMSGSAAKAIDALLLHGEMTAEQLRIHLGCATRTCYNIIGELNKAKLINKNGGRISLKEL